MEKSKITIRILGHDCQIMVSTKEEELRIRKTGALVQSELDGIMQNSNLSQITALIYTALNMGDRYAREQEAMENLRIQITESAERVTKLEKELQKLKEKPKRETTRKAKVLPPEPVAEIKPEPVPVAEIKPEPEPVAEIKPEPVPVAESKPEPVPVVESKPEPEPVAEIKPEPESVAESKPEPVPEIKPEPVAEIKPEPVPVAKSVAEPTLEALTELAQEVERAIDQSKTTQEQ